MQEMTLSAITVTQATPLRHPGGSFPDILQLIHVANVAGNDDVW